MLKQPLRRVLRPPRCRNRLYLPVVIAEDTIKEQQKVQNTRDDLGQLRGRQNLMFPMNIWLNNRC